MLIETISGFVNTDHVVCVDGKTAYLAGNPDGRQYVTLISDVDEKAFYPVVQASPGFWLVCFYEVEGEPNFFVSKDPIVAWRITDAHAIPVTTSWYVAESNCKDRGIMFDGHVWTDDDGDGPYVEWLERNKNNLNKKMQKRNFLKEGVSEKPGSHTSRN